jgi:hypothetical protein
MSGETFQFPTVNAPGRFKRKQTRENVCGLCLDANCCMVSEHTMRLKRRQHCLHYVSTYINRYFYGIKFEKLGNPDVAFPERLHETKHQVNFQESAEWDKSKIHTKTR